MTLPDERRNAVLETRKLLVGLLTPSETPRVPRYIRHMARMCLRHYPTPFDMERPERAFSEVTPKAGR